MRATGVVDLAPSVEGPLSLSQIGEGTAVQNLGLQRAMETLVFALGLGMPGSAMDHAHAQIE